LKQLATFIISKKITRILRKKKISFFLDFIRNKYFLKPAALHEGDIQKIADKSSLSTGKIKSLLREIGENQSHQKN